MQDKRTVTETQATLSQLLDDKKLAKAYIHQVLAITGTKLLKGRSQTIEMAVDHYDVPNDQVCVIIQCYVLLSSYLLSLPFFLLSFLNPFFMYT